MKNNTIKKVGLKAVLALSLALAGFNAQAQQKDPTAIAKRTVSTTLGEVGDGKASTQGFVRVIDNKGTIKYLQVQNGITQITSTAPSGGIVTTWQLGGALTNDTYIDVAGNKFALDGIKVVPNTMVAGTASSIGDLSSHTATTSTATDPYAFLVRNEATGETMKLLPSQLVKTGVALAPVLAGPADMTFTDLAFLPSDVTKVSVYRNGAKLLVDNGSGGDYTLTVGVSGAASTLTVKRSGGADPEDYTLMTSDKIEVQWIN